MTESALPQSLPTVVARSDPHLRAAITAARAVAGVRAGSGLLRVRGRLLVLQDDAHALAWVDAATLAVEPLVLEGDGEALRKKTKPDYEALVQLDAHTVVALGSGSRPNRRRIAWLRWPVAATATVADAAAGTSATPALLRGARPSIEITDATPLYLALEAALGGLPNIEAALVVPTLAALPGGTPRAAAVLRLFHRAAGAAPDAWLDFDPGVLAGAAPRLLGLRRFVLGTVGGVPLHFTDAALRPDGRVLCVAVAENTKDAIADGPVAGAALVLIAADGSDARCAVLREADGSTSRRKPEGIALDPDDPATGHLVTDADDAALPAELCTFVLHEDGEGEVR